MAEAQKDGNYVNSLIAVSSVDGITPVKLYADPTTHRLLVDIPGGSGSVTSVSVVTANGLAGTVATATSTPAITLSTTVTGILKGNGTAISAAVSGTDIKTVNGTSLLGSGDVSVTAAAGGSNTQVQYNNAGALAGITGATTDGTTLTLVAPVLGTPASAILTNATGLPIGTGVSGLGTGIATALAINVGTAGAPVILNGALGTPSSGTVTNLTGTASININGTVGATTPNAGTFTTATANSFIPNSATIPSNGMYLSAANTLGWAVNSAAELRLNSNLFGPAADGGLALGAVTVGWSALNMSSGATIDFNNSNWVATHSAGILTVGTGDLRVTTAGSNTASVVTVGGTQTLTAKTLTSPAVTTATFSGAQVLAEGASIQLDPSLSADGTYSGITITGTAGATLAFGDLIYLSSVDSRWELVDADSVTTCGAVLTGMCVLAAAADGDATTILLQGNIRADAAFPALTVGANVYAGLTAGDIVTTAPSATDDVVHVVGKALTADSIYFNPSQDYITIV